MCADVLYDTTDQTQGNMFQKSCKQSFKVILVVTELVLFLELVHLLWFWLVQSSDLRPELVLYVMKFGHGEPSFFPGGSVGDRLVPWPTISMITVYLGRCRGITIALIKVKVHIRRPLIVPARACAPRRHRELAHHITSHNISTTDTLGSRPSGYTSCTSAHHPRRRLSSSLVSTTPSNEHRTGVVALNPLIVQTKVQPTQFCYLAQRTAAHDSPTDHQCHTMSPTNRLADFRSTLQSAQSQPSAGSSSYPPSSGSASPGVDVGGSGLLSRARRRRKRLSEEEIKERDEERGFLAEGYGIVSPRSVGVCWTTMTRI